MLEWVANTPWWVIAGFSLALIGVVSALVKAAFKAARWVWSVDSRLDSLGETVRDGFTEVRKDIKKILERQAPPPAVRQSSPVRLTDFGEKISAAASARAWADDHASRLTAEASGKQEFEVFETCVAYVAERFDEDDSLQRTIRATAYEFGVDTEQVRKVYEVELRDRLLSRRSESPPPPPRARGTV